jgi:hypothetical protein
MEHGVKQGCAGDLALAARALLERLALVDAPFLKERALHKDARLTPEQFDLLFLELKKYLVLTHYFGPGIGMPSPAVDAIWHHFILFTMKYDEFCRQHFGRFLHHTPDTTLTPIPAEAYRRFYEVYTQVFGQLPLVWTEGGADTSSIENSERRQVESMTGLSRPGPGIAS